MRLKDKVAIITGGGAGLGRASAVLFAKEGAKIVVADIATANGEETASMIGDDDGDAVFVEIDVSRTADCEKMVQTAIDRYGSLDILLNNAGIAGPHDEIADIAEHDWGRIISTNLTGTFLGTKYALPEMVKGGGGVVINISSVAGVTPNRNGAAYAASKAGVIQLTKATALEYGGRNIRANCIVPGAMRTPMLLTITGAQEDSVFEKMVRRRAPMGRISNPEEIARVALFLASDEASYVTGAVVNVDGGYLVG